MWKDTFPAALSQLSQMGHCWEGNAVLGSPHCPDPPQQCPSNSLALCHIQLSIFFRVPPTGVFLLKFGVSGLCGV